MTTLVEMSPVSSGMEWLIKVLLQWSLLLLDELELEDSEKVTSIRVDLGLGWRTTCRIGTNPCVDRQLFHSVARRSNKKTRIRGSCSVETKPFEGVVSLPPCRLSWGLVEQNAVSGCKNQSPP